MRLVPPRTVSLPKRSTRATKRGSLFFLRVYTMNSDLRRGTHLDLGPAGCVKLAPKNSVAKADAKEVSVYLKNLMDILISPRISPPRNVR